MRRRFGIGRPLTAPFATVAEELGEVDALFVNAGIARFAPLGAVDGASFDEQVATNFKGAFFTVQAAGPIFKLVELASGTTPSGRWPAQPCREWV